MSHHVFDSHHFKSYGPYKGGGEFQPLAYNRHFTTIAVDDAVVATRRCYHYGHGKARRWASVLHATRRDLARIREFAG